RDLSTEEKQELDRTTTMSTCESGRIFYMPDDTGEVLFMLKTGRVQLYRMTPDGKKIVVTTLEPGAIFGEMSLIGSGMHNTYAQAIEDCLICVMSRTDLERLFSQKPQVALRFIEAMGNRLQEAEARLEEVAFKSIPSRLASLLLRLSTDQGVDRVIGYTHQDLGEMLGTYRETTTQTLNDFKNQGWINIARKRIEITDREALSHMAEA
ncbi:MAG: Crp/Fnr family transcriptional regulator, partial [Anaerolineales bacterium]